VFIEYESEVESRVSSVKRRVIYFSCLSPMRRNLVLEELRVSRLAVIQEEICCKTS